MLRRRSLDDVDDEDGDDNNDDNGDDGYSVIVDSGYVDGDSGDNDGGWQ